MPSYRALFITLFSTSVAMAQTPAEMKDLQAIYVRESSIASEKLALAERMERLKEWNKSADVYQEILDKYSDRVIPSRSNDQGAVSQYTNVAKVVQERIAKWPEEGLQVYRGRYEESARAILEADPNDRNTLVRVQTRFFATESGRRAGLRLVAGGLERGEFSFAAWIGRRLLTLHPTIEPDRPALLFQTAIAEHLAGNDAAANAHRDELAKKYPDATGTIRGVQTTLAKALEAELSGQPALARTFQSDSWPMPYGTPDAGAVPTQVSLGGARLFSVPIVPTSGRRLNGADPRQIETQLNEPRKRGLLTGIFPCVDNGAVYFQDNARIYAVSLASGLPLPGWQQTYPGDKRGTYSTDGYPTPLGRQLGVCVTEGSVVALLGQSDPLMMGMGVQGRPPQLVSLDRETGKKQWSFAAANLTVPEDQASLKEGQFCGMPLVVNDSVYALIYSNRGGQFEECYLVSLRLSDGAYQWSTYIASTARSSRIDFGEEPSGFGSVAPTLSASDGRVFVQTNLGALACVDGAEGRIVWLNVYARKAGGMVNRRSGFIAAPNTSDRPFDVNPPVISGGRVFVLPNDSDQIMVYDSESGEEIRRLPRLLEKGKRPAEMLLAVVGDELVLANDTTIFVTPWANFDSTKTFEENDGRARKFADDPKDGIVGRPFVSAKSIFIPLAGVLNRMSLDRKTWKVESRYPVQGAWDETEEAPGNIIVTPDHLIIAGHSRVTVYTDLNVATRKLDAQIAAAPRDPQHPLHYAELLFAGGKPTDAIDRLDNAITLLGGEGKIPPGPGRDRVFDIACSFAVKLQKNDRVGSELIQQLFSRAREAAHSPQQQVRYRLAHAQFLGSLNDSKGEIALYQEILAEPSWRSVPVPGESATSAAAYAEARQALLVSRNLELYLPYTTQAKQKLDAALAQNPRDAAALIAVADEYPIDVSAVEALREAAQLQESQGLTRPATLALRRLLKRSRTTETSLFALESLARNYAGMPGQIDLAILRLEQAAKLQPARKLSRPITLVDGTKIENDSLESAIVTLRTSRDRAAGTSLPLLGLKPGTDKPFEAPEAANEIAAIVPQKAGIPRNDRVVTLTTGHAVTQVKAGTIEPLHAPVKVEIDYDPFSCAYSGDLLVVATGKSVTAIESSGTPRWQSQLEKWPVAETPVVSAAPAVSDAGEDDNQQQRVILRGRVVARQGMVVGGGRVIFNGEEVTGPDPSNGPELISHFRLLSDRAIVATTHGRIAAIDLQSGSVTWQIRPDDESIRHLLATDDFVVAATSSDGRSGDLYVFDALSGEMLRHKTYQPDRNGMPQPISNVALSRDGVLVTTLFNRIEGLDLYDPDAAGWKEDLPNDQVSSSSSPDQLVITGGYALAVCRGADGTQEVVRAYNLRTGKAKRGTDNMIEASFASGAKPATDRRMQVAIRPAGDVFCIFGPKSLAMYHLRSDWQNRAVGLDNPDHGVVRDLIMTRDYFVLISQSASIANANASKVALLRLAAYSREELEGGAISALLEHRPSVRDPGSILVGQWQITDGAFYYVSADKKLKMLKAGS